MNQNKFIHQKYCFYLFIFFLLFFSHSHAVSLNENNVSAILKEAEDAYKQKNYTKTIELYQSVLNNNYHSFEIYYNLGNAYFKNNQLGKSILYYEKAKLLNPSDADLNHNLKIAYNKTIDKIETKDNFFIEITKNNFLNKLNINAIIYTIIILSFLTLTIFILFLYYQNYRKITLPIILILIVLNVSLYILAYSANKNRNTDDFAVVTTKEIKVKNEPLPDAVTKFTLHEGTKVKVLQKIDNFLLIRLENGIEGWIDIKTVEFI